MSMKCSISGLARGLMPSRWRTMRFRPLFCLLCLVVLEFPASTTAQIAALYPNDVGIRNHPSVISATGFESANWQSTDFPSNTRFSYVGGTDPQARPQWTGDEAHTGTGALLHRQLAGTNLPHGLTIMGFSGVDEIYMRWYRKYQAGYRWGCRSAKNNGVYAVADPTKAEACVQPTGYDKFSFRVQDERRSADSGDFFGALYSYHPHADNGGCGEWYSQNQGGVKYQQPGKWYSYEIYIRANTVGQSNGVLKMWVDGELRGHQEGLEFRFTDQLQINQIYLYRGDSRSPPPPWRLSRQRA